MEKFNKFTSKIKEPFDINEFLYKKLTRQVLLEKIPIYIKKAIIFGWNKDLFSSSYLIIYDKECNFCGKKTLKPLMSYISPNSNKCLDVCVICDELMVSYK